MKAIKLILVGAIVLATSLVSAQGFPGGGQGRGGMMMRGGMGGNTLFLLMREDVREDIKLTDDQNSKLQAMQQNVQNDMRDIFQNNNGDRNGMRKAMEEYMTGLSKKVSEILTPDQNKRLKEIGIQMEGARAALRADIQKDLGLSEEQVAKLKKLNADYQAGTQAMFGKVRNGELSMEEVQEKMKSNEKAFGAEIEKILTEAQRGKLKEMGGKPFVRKDDQA